MDESALLERAANVLCIKNWRNEEIMSCLVKLCVDIPNDPTDTEIRDGLDNLETKCKRTLESFIKLQSCHSSWKMSQTEVPDLKTRESLEYEIDLIQKHAYESLNTKLKLLYQKNLSNGLEAIKKSVEKKLPCLTKETKIVLDIRVEDLKKEKNGQWEIFYNEAILKMDPKLLHARTSTWDKNKVIKDLNMFLRDISASALSYANLELDKQLELWNLAIYQYAHHLCSKTSLDGKA
jgi:hypothetical protein